MTNQEAINFLKQIYPQGGCCYLDEQRMTAIGMAIEALLKKEEKSGVMWRKIDKSPDFAESGKQLLENGVKLYKNINIHMVVGLSKDGVLSWICNQACDSYRGDGYYLTFDDLLSLPKEGDADRPAENEDESTKE